MADLMRMSCLETEKTFKVGELVFNYDFGKDQVEAVCARGNLEIGLFMVTLLRTRGDNVCLGRPGVVCVATIDSYREDMR